MKSKTLILLTIVLSVVTFAQKERPLIKTFSVSEGGILEARIDPGNVEVNTWDKNEVKIEIVSKNEYKVEDLVAEKSGTIIKFYLEIDNDWDENILVKIYSPKRFSFDLRTTGGNISVENDLIGKFKVNSEGGNIEFKNISGETLVNTSGGNISGENISGNTTLHTNGGNISLKNIKSGRTDLNTFGGNISVGSVNSDISAKTHGGSISVGNVGGNANVFTYGGHISMEKVSGSAKMETYGGHLSLEGASGKVAAKTMGGHINLKNITGSIDASTEGGHVYAELDTKGNTNSSLSTSGGNMELKIPSSAKATIEVFIETDEFEKDEVEEILQSDFPSSKLNADGDEGKINATYVINGGGAKISMKCSGGEVKIKKWNK